jgi:hypothetical protein
MGVKIHLDTRLGQVDLQSDLLPHEYVRVAGLPEKGLEDVELSSGERRPLTPLLPGVRCEK